MKDPLLKQLHNNKRVGTMIYMAPELLRNERFCEKIDVYSFGLIMWEIFTRQRLFPNLGLNDGAKLREMILGGERPPLPETLPTQLRELIARCWEESALRRPSFDEISYTLTEIFLAEMIEDDQGRDMWRSMELYGLPQVEWAVFERNLREEIEVSYEEQLIDLPEQTSQSLLESASDFQLVTWSLGNRQKDQQAREEFQRRYGDRPFCDIGLDLNMELTCIKRLLRVDHNNGSVGIKEWGDLLRWFGPLCDGGSGFPTFFQRVSALWFRLFSFSHSCSSSECSNCLTFTDLCRKLNPKRNFSASQNLGGSLSVSVASQVIFPFP